MFKCVRFYPNGDKREILCIHQMEVDGWLEYNKKYRFGNSLFVNGKCEHRGVYHTEAQCVELEKLLAEEITTKRYSK